MTRVEDNAACVTEMLRPAKRRFGTLREYRLRYGIPYGAGARMKDRRLARIEQSGGMMIVHRPAAVRDDVIEITARAHVVLREDVIADVTTVLALAGQGTDPFQRPIRQAEHAFGCVVFDVIPHAVADLHQFIADALGVADRVLQTADLHPPEIVRADAVDAVRQIGFARELDTPSAARCKAAVRRCAGPG